jgi:hypothetical protein
VDLELEPASRQKAHREFAGRRQPFVLEVVPLGFPKMNSKSSIVRQTVVAVCTSGAIRPEVLADVRKRLSLGVILTAAPQ